MHHFYTRILSAAAAAALMLCSQTQNAPSFLRFAFSPAMTASAAETSGTCGDNARWAYDEATN